MRIFGKVSNSCTGIALLLLAGMAAPSQAGILFSDLFNTNGTLVGSTPGTSGGNWTQTGTTATNPMQVTSNKLVMGILGGQDAFAALTAPVANTGGTSLFTGATINVTSATATGDYFLHLSDPLATTANFYQRLYVRSSGAGFNLGFQSISGTGTVITYGSTVFSFNTDLRVVTGWNFVTGTANDTFNVYVNPTNAVEGSNAAEIAGYTWTGSAEPANIAGVNVRQGSAANSAALTVDDLTVATLFTEAAGLAAVPEPGSLALLGLAALPGFALLRRRKLAK